jgi:uncharacterized protein YceK
MDNAGFADSSDYYKGTNTDIKVLGGQGSAGYVTMFCYVTIICPVFFLASIPADLLVDTLLVPYDYGRAARLENMDYDRARSTAKHGVIKFDFSASSSFKGDRSSIGYLVDYVNKNKKLYLYVASAPLKSSSMEAYIPLVKGYAPKEISFYYGDTFAEIRVRISCGVESSVPGSGAVNEGGGLGINGKSFIYYDGGDSVERKESRITVTPFLSCNGARIFVDSGYSSPSRTQ